MTSMEEPEWVAFDNVDPTYEWLDDGANYLLRLELPGFRKEDFRVYVNTEGQLTVIAQRKPTPGTGDHGKGLRLRKLFQLPNTANLDTISGRFDGAVLMLSVPKLQQLPAAGPGAATAPPPRPQAKEEARVPGDKPAGQEDKAAKVGREAETARRAEAERAALARSREEDKKAKTVAPQPPPPQPQRRQQQQQQSERASGEKREEDEDEKARACHREEVSREAARRIEAARTRVAEAKAKAEGERKCEHWKERAMEEGLKFADALNKNKEAIATAVAAFTLGVFVSGRLFSRN